MTSPLPWLWLQYCREQVLLYLLYVISNMTHNYKANTSLEARVCQMGLKVTTTFHMCTHFSTVTSSDSRYIVGYTLLCGVQFEYTSFTGFTHFE